MTTFQAATGTRTEFGIVTALRHLDHGVSCDDSIATARRGVTPAPCLATVWRSEVDTITNKSLRGFRDELRRRGWQLGVLPENLGILNRNEPLDFCPDHRKEPQ